VTHAEVAALDAQGLAHREEGVEHQFLRHDAQGVAGLGEVADHVVPHDGDPPLGGTGQTGQDADEGGLAGPVGTQQAEELAFGDVEADAIQGPERALPSLVHLGDALETDGGHGRDSRETAKGPRHVRVLD